MVMKDNRIGDLSFGKKFKSAKNAVVLLATLVGSPWPAYRRSILQELEVLSSSLGRIFEHSVHLSRMSARLAMLARLPSWSGFVSTADYALNTASRLVDEMSTLKGTEDGLLAQMISSGIQKEDLQRIVVDLILAAGDTVSSNPLSFSELEWI